MSLEIRQAEALTEELVEAVARLLSQLSASTTLNAERLQALIESATSALLVARLGGAIVGMLALAWYDVPTGRKAWIEDVVVDAGVRRSGAGRALIDAALALATKLGVQQVRLTSNPTRTAARGLYHDMGFEIADTSVFTLALNGQ